MSEQVAPLISAAASLAVWAKEQDDWVGHLAAYILTNSSPASSDVRSEAYKLLLRDQGLSDEPLEFERQNVINTATSTESSGALLITSVGAMENVNALIADQTIEFNDRLTVIYGENACGKSGYARVVKAAAGSRSASSVLGNVYEPTRGNPRAIITFQDGSVSTPFNWENPHAIEALARTCVFDSQEARLHIDDDLDYHYTPAEFGLFEYLHEALASVRSRLDDDRSTRVPGANAFISRFRRGTEAFKLVETLRASTNMDQLDALATLPDDLATELEDTRRQLAGFQGTTSRSELELLALSIQFLESASATLTAAQTFDVAKYNAAVAALKQAKLEQDETTANAFSQESFPGADSAEWLNFLVAGKQYTDKHYHEYPKLNESCVYCRQPLDEHAIARLIKYSNYLVSKANTSHETAVKSLRAASQPMTETSLATLKQEVLARADGDDTSAIPQPLMEKLVSEVERIEALQGFVRSSTPIHPSASPAVTPHELWERKEGLAAQLHAVKTHGADREARRGELQKRLVELEDRKSLSESAGAIRQYVAGLKWADLAKVVSDRISTLLRSLTTVSKDASESFLRQNFEDAFVNECIKLRCPTIKLDFPGRQGVVKRHKTVGEQPLARVLSEGEQKVIALADFLAELSLRSSSAPVIFDDPITSLDFRRSEEVANRLVELSAEHQVIVFTHSLFFASALLAPFDEGNRRGQCSYFEILDEDGQIGLVTKGDHPKTDTPNNLAKRVNASLSRAQNKSGDDRQREIADAYGLMRSWVEAYVEQTLLGDTVRRLRSNVVLNGLQEINSARLDAAIANLVPTFDRCCRFMTGHSQPTDQLHRKATIDDVRTDWETLKAVKDAYGSK